MTMTEPQVTLYITSAFPGVETTTNFGYQFFFYGADRRLAFATIASTDNEYEHISNLNRPGVYRLNIGVSKPTFQALFGTDPVDLSAYDFTALDVLMPHPDYYKQNFVCVLVPGEATWARVRDLLEEGYTLAVRRDRRQGGDL